MRHCWPADTRFTRVVLEVEDKVCAVCGGTLHICDHRRHRIFTLQGPVEVVCKLAHCSDLQCAARAKTRSPYAETTLTLPWWLIGWGRCYKGVDPVLEGYPKLIAIHEEANHQIVHRRRLGKANRAAHETFDPGA